MPQREVRPPRYIARDRAGIAHATDQWGTGWAYCGFKLYNFNKRTSLEPYEWGDGFSYTPPPDARVTCLACLGAQRERREGGT